MIETEQSKYLSKIKEMLSIPELQADDFYNSSLSIFFNNCKRFFVYIANRLCKNILQFLSFCQRSEMVDKILEDYGDKISLYYFYSLYYKLSQYNFLTLKDKQYILNIFNLPGEKFRTSIKLDCINGYIAKIIFDKIHVKKMLNQQQIVELKKIYYRWVKSLNISLSARSYLTRKDKTLGSKPDDHTISYIYLPYGRLVNLGLNKDSKNSTQSTRSIKSTTSDQGNKNAWFKTFKSFFIFQANIAIVFTAIAQGLLPAVLVTTVSSGLLVNILWVGVPSIIINYVFYNKSVHDLIKDLWHGRLLRTFWLGLLAFLIALCGGITYSILMYSTTVAALQLIISLILPMLAWSSVVYFSVLLSAMIAIYTAVALTAMYYSAILELELNPIKIFYNIKKFLIKNIQTKHYWYIFAKFILYSVITVGAGYLALIEASMFYGGMMGLFNIQWLSVAMIALATPANFIFSANVFNNFYLLLKNLPEIIESFFKHFKRNCTNPIAFYEDLKWLCKFSILLIFNFDNSQGLAIGIAEETKNPLCKSFLDKFKINPDQSVIQTLSMATGGIDSFISNGTATIDTIGNPVFHSYGCCSDKDTVVQSGVRSLNVTKASLL